MNNTKLLVFVTVFILISGLALIFHGLPSHDLFTVEPKPSSQSQTESTVSAQISGDRVTVTRVVDGDTIKVEMNGKEETVRLLGMNTPETVDPRKPVECFGKEASNETKSLLTGKIVILQKDVSETDKYKRLLRFVFLPLENGQILFVDDYLVREGFAQVLTIPPDVKHSEQFLQAQKAARDLKKGLWGKC